MERSASVGVNDGRFGGNQFYSPSFSSSSSSSSMRHVNYRYLLLTRQFTESCGLGFLF